MSVPIDPRQILHHLNEMGYKNISGQQLKAFIKDLKTLMKYDQKVHNLENIDPETNRANRSCETVQTNLHHLLKDCNRSETFNTLHSTSTVSSRAKEVPRRNKIISIQITKAAEKVPIQPSMSTLVADEVDTCKSHSTERTEFAFKPCIKSVRRDDANRDEELKPKVSFIRPRKPVYGCKSDPVALYHSYQAEWKRRKLPGEDMHKDLRWAVRERMLGDPLQQSAVSIKQKRL